MNLPRLGDAERRHLDSHPAIAIARVAHRDAVKRCEGYAHDPLHPHPCWAALDVAASTLEEVEAVVLDAFRAERGKLYAAD